MLMNYFFKASDSLMPLINSSNSYDVCPKCAATPTRAIASMVPPQHKELGLGSDALGPKGALFYQQLQCYRTRQDALLCNKFGRMNRLQHRPSECQWKLWEERVVARIIQGESPWELVFTVCLCFPFTLKCAG